MPKIDAGTYRGHAVKDGAYLTIAKSGTEGVYVPLDLGEAGRIVWRGWLSEKCMERTFKTLRDLGWKTDSLEDLEGIGDTEVDVVVDDEEYDGKTHSVVRWINALGAGKMEADKVKTFAARMAGEVKRLGLSAADVAAAKKDDIPF